MRHTLNATHPGKPAGGNEAAVGGEQAMFDDKGHRTRKECEKRKFLHTNSVADPIPRPRVMTPVRGHATRALCTTGATRAGACTQACVHECFEARSFLHMPLFATSQPHCEALQGEWLQPYLKALGTPCDVASEFSSCSSSLFRYLMLILRQVAD